MSMTVRHSKPGIRYSPEKCQNWPKLEFGRIAGRIYIAWCLAATVLPIVAGYLYDLTGTYRMAVIVAGGANCLERWAHRSVVPPDTDVASTAEAPGTIKQNHVR